MGANRYATFTLGSIEGGDVTVFFALPRRELHGNELFSPLSPERARASRLTLGQNLLSELRPETQPNLF